MAEETLKNVILNEREDYPKGESRAQASLGMTEPKGRGVAPSSHNSNQELTRCRLHYRMTNPIQNLMDSRLLGNDDADLTGF